MEEYFNRLLQETNQHMATTTASMNGKEVIGGYHGWFRS